MNGYSKTEFSSFFKDWNELSKSSACRISRKIQSDNIIFPIMNFLNILQQCGVYFILSNIAVETHNYFYFHLIFKFFFFLDYGIKKLNYREINSWPRCSSKLKIYNIIFYKSLKNCIDIFPQSPFSFHHECGWIEQWLKPISELKFWMSNIFYLFVVTIFFKKYQKLISRTRPSQMSMKL